MARIADLVAGVLEQNHIVMEGQNPNAIYLAGTTEDQLDKLDLAVREITEELKDNAAIQDFVGTIFYLDARNKTYYQILNELAEHKASNSQEAYYHVEENLHNNNWLVVIRGMSQCKESAVPCMRELIKFLDDAHLSGVHPRSDLIFIDSAAFLERHWSTIGSYVTTNIIGIE